MIVSNILQIERDELTQKQWRKLLSRLTFLDDDQNEWRFYRWRRNRKVMEMPRGAWSFPELDNVVFEDRRSCPVMPELDFTIKLDAIDKNPNFAGQSEAVASMLDQEQGLVVRMPGSGKSQIGLAFIATCCTRSLVIVHTHDLMQQWATYAERAIPGIDIGLIQGRNYKIGHLTIATVQTLKDFVDLEDFEWWEQFGATIVDETHHAPANTWQTILNNSVSRYRIGLTATEKRADGMGKAVQYLIGPVIHKGEFEPEIPTECIPVKTGYYFPYRGSFDWGRLIKDIVRDEKRNKCIAEIADREVNEGNFVLILSRSIKHLELIQEQMKTGRNQIFAASGPSRVPKAERKNLVKNMRSGKLRCVLATQLADEGLDVPRLNRVLLVHPGKFEGKIRQQVGRVLRAHPEKVDAKVYDFIDEVPVLRRQWRERKRAYKPMKIPVRKLKGDHYAEKIGKRLVSRLVTQRSTRSRDHARRTNRGRS
jgi:superfamily II DNA or RNA helicase